MIKIRKGLDLPVYGKPQPIIDNANKPKSVALTGFDYVGMKPTMLVKEGDSVKIGISAPRSISILRREILEEMQSSNQAAAMGAKPQLGSLKSTLAAGSALKLIQQMRAKKASQAEEKK